MNNANESGLDPGDLSELLTRYEWMSAVGWQPWHKLEAMSYVKAMDDETKRIADEIMAGRVRLPKDALRMLEAMAGFNEKDRARLKELWDSKEDRRRSLAISKLTGCAPLPDPRIAIVFPALGILEQAITSTREASEVEPLAQAKDAVKTFLRLIRSREETW